VLTIVSVFYLLYLAYKIGTANSKVLGQKATSSPITFLQAVFFQWVNPKAWTMALAAITVYTPQPVTNYNIIMVSLIFGAINLPSINFWVILGAQMRHLLTTDTKLRIFNWTMASLLVLSLYPIVNLQLGI
jgi:threonine/homoserine/homoserine lactone efflux protein